MRKRPLKTTGAEFLYLSMASFNGSGYAVKNSPEEYVASYRAYNIWRKRIEHLETLDSYPEEAMFFAVALVDAKNSPKKPNEKNQAKFNKIYNQLNQY